MPEMRCLAVFSAMLFATAAMAHGNSVGVLMVRAEVKPSAVLRFEAKTPQLVISAADIAQGYVEIPAAAFFNLSAGKFRPLVFLDSIELKSDGGVYRFELAGKLGPGHRLVPVTLGIEL
jgi:hypothetical protein